MQKPHITIIGGGNMGFSLIGGILSNGYDPHCITVADPSKTQLHAISHQFAVNVTHDNEAAIKDAQVVLLAVKPQVLKSILQPLAPTIQRNKTLLISIAAGLTAQTLQDIVGEDIAIIRCMPNTPALIGCGATGLYANAHVSDLQKEIAEMILRSVGLVVWVENENLIDVITALSGSGPAYFFLIMELLAEGAEKLGLNAEQAKLLTMQTAYGAARMALESSDSLVDLRKKVTSPGGTTASAIASFEKNNLAEIIFAALTAAKERSEELAKE